MTLRIASYNIHRTIGRDGQRDPARIAEVLQELDADIVALQEVDYQPNVPGDVLEYLGRSMQARVIEGATIRHESGHYGNAVLSRLPVAAVERLDLSFPGREPRGALELSLRLKRMQVQLITTHLGLRRRERVAQVNALLPRFEASSADVQILLGDLNEWFVRGRPLRGPRQMFGKAPAPATFPAHRPWFALDRLWVKPASLVGHVFAHKSARARIASDHLPLVAELHVE